MGDRTVITCSYCGGAWPCTAAGGDHFTHDELVARVAATARRNREIKSDRIVKNRNSKTAITDERDKLRELFEYITNGMWDATADLSWEDWEYKAEELGLLVKVPASERFKEEWDHDKMLVWSWSNAAVDAAKNGRE